MMNKILIYLIALGVSIAIALLGYKCAEIIYTPPIERDWSWMDWLAFIGFYVIVIKPVADFWTDKICDILGIPKNN
jgi:hypothetical protein